MGSGGVQKQLSQKTPCSKKKTSPTLIQSNSHMATCPYSSNNIIRGTGNGERETDSKEVFFEICKIKTGIWRQAESAWNDH